jgi:hypothetical protein
MRNMKYSKVIGSSILLLALACIAVTFLYPGLRMAIGQGNGYGYPCETPADCEDANDCTTDTCDPVAGCIWSCNATGPEDPCCGDAFCAGAPICASGGPCAGSPDASVPD